MTGWAELGPLGPAIREQANAELWRYLAAGARVRRGARLDASASLAGLAPEDFQLLASAHLLLSDEVSAFLTDVPKVFRRLARSTEAPLSVGSDVRGPIDWERTWAARAGWGWSVPLFAVREAQPLVDVAPNRVLKATLRVVRDLAFRVLGAPRARAAAREIAATEGARWVDHASAVGSRAAELLRAKPIATVAASTRVGERDLRAAYDERSRLYRSAVAVQRMRRALIDRLDPEALHRLWERRLLGPGQDARIYELWVLSRIAAFLRARGAEVVPRPLLAEGRHAPAYRFRTAYGEIAVHFQGLPAALRSASNYKDIFAAYSLGVASRLPDIVIEARRADEVRRLIVEVKASRRAGYIADGVYKVLGYIADFGDEVRPLGDGLPSGLLVALDQVDLLPGADRAGHACRIATFATLDAELDAVLRPVV